MPYYVRVLSTSSECVPLNQLQFALKPDQGQAILTVEQGTPGDWTQIILSHSDGQEISSIERNVRWMRVLRDGKWTHFEMDLGNQKQRESFFQGLVPDDVKLAK